MNSKQTGMALVLVMILGAIGFLVLTLGLTASSIALQSSLQTAQGGEALHVAESGAENALIRMIRDPNYTGETLTIGDGTATITVTGTNPQTLTVVGVVGTATRSIQISVTQVDGATTITSWTEIP